MKVFYTENQNFENNDSVSPSAGKPKLVVEDWLNKGYQITIEDFSPLEISDFYLAHSEGYVNDIFALRAPNGFGNRLEGINKTLLWTNGSLVAAALEAYKAKENTCSPTSGFHHAGYEGYHKLGYFCTFNGIVIAVEKLRAAGAAKVGVLDLDHHWGNGTDDIITKKKIDYIVHYSFGRDHSVRRGRIPSNYDWNGGGHAEKWLEKLPTICGQFSDCDVVIYQAGADPHKDDPFGGALTDSQLLKRDEIVFSRLKEMGIPVAWCLAGGYQNPIEKVLVIHRRTLEACLRYC